MQDNIPDALITAFERQYDSSWNDPKLRKERLAMRYGWAAAMEAKPCLHQIQEPAPALTAPRLDDAWKVRMLDGQPLVRDKDGIGYHPALPDFDEGVKCADFFSALGIELKCGMAENEMDSDAYEAMTENGLTEDGDNYNAWTPARPEGEGWNLVAVFDTEDGPACWWMRDKPAVPFHERVENYRTRVDNAAVDVLAMNMKAKLAVQRDKGYRGWNNDCTQQHLSDLLRQCVDKGDPVDVANFCAFLLARGETIAQLAAPVAAGEREAFEAWARSYGSWEVKRDDDQALGTTGYTDLTLTVAWHAIQGRAALAATPAAAPVDKSPELQGSMVDKNMNLQGLEAAPVVLPEPFALYDGEKWYANEEAAICSCANMQKLQKVYTEQQVRALLATGGQAQAVSHSVAKTEPVWIAARNLNSIRADYQRETGDTHPGNDYWAGRFAAGYVSLMDAVIDLQLKEPATQQADARDAWTSIESAPKDGTWIQLWRTPEPEESPVNSTPLVIGRWSDEEESFVWPDDQFYDPFTEHGKANADQMVEAMQTYASNEFTHWAPLSMPSVHRAAIAAAKGE